MLKKLSLYLRTIKYLKPIQVFWRFFYIIIRKVHFVKNPNVILSEVQNKKWNKINLKKSNYNNKLYLKILNTSYDLRKNGWDSKKFPKLLIYNVHYFEYILCQNKKPSKNFEQNLILDWIKKNPIGKTIGWDSYPTSLRIVNWIKWMLNENIYDKRILDSLSIQSNWLFSRIEWHLLANHLFVNAKALIFSGIFFNGKIAESWLSKGLEILETQLDEQILEDGGHFELSTMYHGLILEDILDLINLGVSYSKSLNKSQRRFFFNLKILSTRMLYWYEKMHHPDNKISFFNDATFEISSDYIKLNQIAKKLGIKNKKGNKNFNFFEKSGYFRFDKWSVVLIGDVGRVGPSYMPGHAHADTLSFEMSIDGKRLVVNSGVSTYSSSKVRLLQRGTPCHSTLNYGNLNSSEVWSSLRLGIRASTTVTKYFKNKNKLYMSAFHDGYNHLNKNYLHRRDWSLEKNLITIEDYFSNNNFFGIEIKFFLHPFIKPQLAGEKIVCFNLKEKSKVAEFNFEENLNIEIINTFWYPAFNKRIKNFCISIRPNEEFKNNKIKTYVNI